MVGYTDGDSLQNAGARYQDSWRPIGARMEAGSVSHSSLLENVKGRRFRSGCGLLYHAARHRGVATGNRYVQLFGAFCLGVDRMFGELLPGAARRVKNSHKLTDGKLVHHRSIRLEAIEDRRMLSIGSYPEIPGMILVDPVES